MIPDIEATTGGALSRILADAGCKGHKTPPGCKFKVYTQGQKRGVTEAIKRQFSRRVATDEMHARAGIHCASTSFLPSSQMPEIRVCQPMPAFVCKCGSAARRGERANP